MSFTTVVQRWMVTDEDVVYECRMCGTTVEPPEGQCPSCGSTEIAEYEVSSLS